MPSREPARPLPELWHLLGSVLVALISWPLVELRHRWWKLMYRLDRAMEARRDKPRDWLDEPHDMRGEFAKLWENKAGRALIIIVGLYIAWRIL